MTRLAFLVLVATASTAAAEPAHQMTVTGTGTLMIAPDCADLTMVISVEHARPAGATAAAKAKADGVVAALARVGLKAPDVAIAGIDLEPVYPQGEYTTPRAFRSSVTLLVTTHDFSRIPAVMQAGADAGAQQMRTQFRRNDMPSLKKQVRAMAITAAQEKATDMAKQLGIKLGRVIVVAEGTEPRWGGEATYANAVTTRSGPSLGGTLQNLTIDVSLTYEL